MSGDQPGEIKVDIAEVRRTAAVLHQCASELRRKRLEAIVRLANGRGDRPALKVKEDIKVNIGAVDFEHEGTKVGELVAAKVKSCDHSFNAAEDGMRAMGTMMSRMATALENQDELNAGELKDMMEDLYYVYLVDENGNSSGRPDFFGTKEDS